MSGSLNDKTVSEGADEAFFASFGLCRLIQLHIKPVMDSRAVAGLDAERQALAPSIAKVFDAELTPAGRPFFVMEGGSGLSIAVYCVRHRSAIRERLAFFLPVCDGVQQAHQKAIVHRDRKPPNVLVEGDYKAVPKIIDFGLAEAMGQRLAPGLRLGHNSATDSIPPGHSHLRKEAYEGN